MNLPTGEPIDEDDRTSSARPAAVACRRDAELHAAAGSSCQTPAPVNTPAPTTKRGTLPQLVASRRVPTLSRRRPWLAARSRPPAAAGQHAVPLRDRRGFAAGRTEIRDHAQPDQVRPPSRAPARSGRRRGHRCGGLYPHSGRGRSGRRARPPDARRPRPTGRRQLGLPVPVHGFRSGRPLKLLVLRETWGVTIERPTRRRSCCGRARPRVVGCVNKKCGLEVIIMLPPAGRAVGEVTVTGAIFGTPDQDFTKQANEAIPRLIADVRQELKNVDDRRKHPRVAANFPVTLYPIHSAGGIDMPLTAGAATFRSAASASRPTDRCRRSTPMECSTASRTWPVRSCPLLATHTFGRENIHGGQFRTDLRSCRVGRASLRARPTAGTRDHWTRSGGPRRLDPPYQTRANPSTRESTPRSQTNTGSRARSPRSRGPSRVSRRLMPHEREPEQHALRDRRERLRDEQVRASVPVEQRREHEPHDRVRAGGQPHAREQPHAHRVPPRQQASSTAVST